ncbi:MAG: nucleotidyltransferase domain-containing protein [Candidatus Diapherotrites archaeon]|nr:nucleotidyltransferase domain-containing protein [Candidatus Micrarchaeota archaeon]MBU1939987.1 nucleotidyltransferase domain-containing protein [Candidatus Micrarchaeota archaeon]
MLHGWQKFKGWKVLEFFLAGGGRIHVNGLAAKLGISPGTAQEYLTGYERQGVLERERAANAINYMLAETPLTLELKKAYFVSLLADFGGEFEKENPYVATLALYGSHAKGTYDEKSDIDLLAISQEKKLRLGSLKKIEEKTGREAKLQSFTLAEWKGMLAKKDSFASAVIRNNIVLLGAQL